MDVHGCLECLANPARRGKKQFAEPSKNLFPARSELSFPEVKEKWNKLLPVLFVAVFAVSRIPGLMPANFSVAYAFAFCAGVYFRGATAWWLPLGTMLATDVALNIFYYHVAPFAFYLLLNYAIFAVLIGLGKWFGRRASFFKLLLGGLLGAVIFYLVTNTLVVAARPRLRQDDCRLDSGADHGPAGRAADDVGNVPQHALERRAVHRAVCRGGKIDRARRIARRQNRRRARAGKGTGRPRKRRRRRRRDDMTSAERLKSER